MNKLMLSNEEDERLLILLVEDVEETRDCIEKMLARDGYRVEAARIEKAAIESARRNPPDLILVCLEDDLEELVASSIRIRTQADLSNDVPIVIFCCETVEEGEKISLGDNVYVIHPDDFNQLRRFLSRVLSNLALVA